MKYGPPFELIAADTAEKIRQQLAPKLNDADVAVIKATIAEEFSKLHGTIESMGWSLVKMPDPGPDPH